MDETTAVFSIGDPHPVTDPRQLPAVSADEEAALLGGLVGGDDQPDGPVADDEGDPLPTDAELDALVADLPADDVDEVGFDDTDVVDLEVPLDPDVAAALGAGSFADPVATVGSL